jgi:hypothetical protein
VGEETAILKQGEQKLLPDSGVVQSEKPAIVSSNKRLFRTGRSLPVDPPAKLFASYSRGLAAAGHAVLGMHRHRCQRRGAVENTQHLRA